MPQQDSGNSGSHDCESGAIALQTGISESRPNSPGSQHTRANAGVSKMGPRLSQASSFNVRSALMTEEMLKGWRKGLNLIHIREPGKRQPAWTYIEETVV